MNSRGEVGSAAFSNYLYLMFSHKLTTRIYSSLSQWDLIGGLQFLLRVLYEKMNRMFSQDQDELSCCKSAGS